MVDNDTNQQEQGTNYIAMGGPATIQTWIDVPTNWRVKGHGELGTAGVQGEAHSQISLWRYDKGTVAHSWGEIVNVPFFNG